MKASIREIFPAFYNERQTASAVRHVGQLDRMLIDDGTYFVIEDGERFDQIRAEGAALDRAAAIELGLVVARVASEGVPE